MSPGLPEDKKLQQRGGCRGLGALIARLPFPPPVTEGEPGGGWDVFPGLDSEVLSCHPCPGLFTRSKSLSPASTQGWGLELQLWEVTVNTCGCTTF